MQVFNNKQVCKFDMNCSYVYFILKERSYIIQFTRKLNQIESLNMSMVPQIRNLTHNYKILVTARKKLTDMIFSLETKSSVTYLNMPPVKAMF